MAKRFFEFLLKVRWYILLALPISLVVMGYLGREVKPDFSVEQFFPTWHPARH